MTKAMKTSYFWFTRFAELALATTLVFLITAYLNQREADRFDAIPPTDWFEVVEVYVPDFETGEDPLIVYDRTIKTNFSGFWVAEIERLDGPGTPDRAFAACTGSGTNNYGISDYLDKTKVTLSWFMERQCNLEPGTYRIVTTWDMRIPGNDRVKRYKNVSDVFRVWPEGRAPRHR